MKLAPKLKRFLAVASLPCRPDGAWTKESGELWVAADAEFRALLAVARAAKDHSHAEVEYDPVSEAHLCAICRALARLGKVSKP